MDIKIESIRRSVATINLIKPLFARSGQIGVVSYQITELYSAQIDFYF